MKLDIKKLFTFVGVLGFLLLLALFFLFVRPHLPSLHPKDIQKLLLSLGPRAVAVYLFLYMFRYLFALSSTLLNVMAGMVWGVWLGAFYAALGCTLNGVFLFVLARLFGQKAFQAYFKEQTGSIPLLTAYIEKKAFLSMTFLRLFPVLLFEGPCLLAGFARVKLLPYFAGTFLGSFPWAFYLAFAGTRLHDFSAKSLSLVGVFIAVMVIFSVLLVLFLRKPLLQKLTQAVKEETL